MYIYFSWFFLSFSIQYGLKCLTDNIQKLFGRNGQNFPGVPWAYKSQPNLPNKANKKSN